MVSEVKKQNKPELIKKKSKLHGFKEKKNFFLHVFRFTHGKIHRKKKNSSDKNQQIIESSEENKSKSD